ncbi:MAG: SpoIIE family protein phosphatase [Lachnospiraceae bacterium]|nr:SpoIIE family protein phosphatase [Lachnospiraceae bacterium]
MKTEKNKRNRNLKQKMAALTLMFLDILTVIIIGICIMIFTRSSLEKYNENISSIVKLSLSTQAEDYTEPLVAMIDEVIDEKYNEVGGDEFFKDMTDEKREIWAECFSEVVSSKEYKKLEKSFEDIQKDFDAKSYYLRYYNEKNDIGFYLLDKSSGEANPFGTIMSDEEKELTGNPEYINAIPTMTYYWPGEGWLMSAGTVVPCESGGMYLYGVDLSLSSVAKTIIHATVWIVIASAIITFMLIRVMLKRIGTTIVNPVSYLAKATKKIISEDENGQLAISDNLVMQDVKVNTGDEIEVLANSFVSMEITLHEFIDNLEKVTAEKERIGAELNVATNIQAQMLPKNFEEINSEFDKYNIFASMSPAKEVGGDFYDFFKIDDTHLGLVMADVSGKGVPAALFMVRSMTIIKNRALVGGLPSEILAFVNNQLCENNEAELFTTCWFGVLDTTTGVITAASAGHEYPCVKHNGRFELLKDKHGFVLGGMEGARYKDYTIELSKGDSLFLYTDGVPEATNASDELFGNDRLIEALNADTGADSEELLSIVRSSVDRFVGEAPQFDDLTMLCISFY